jgi:hypothetical protein
VYYCSSALHDATVTSRLTLPLLLLLLLILHCYCCYYAQQEEQLPDFMWGVCPSNVRPVELPEVQEVDLSATLSGVIDSAVLVSNGQCMADTSYRSLQGLRGCSVTAAGETLRQDLLAVAQVRKAVTVLSLSCCLLRCLLQLVIIRKVETLLRILKPAQC